MKSYLAVVEIPKGSDRRIHLSFDKSQFVDLGPIKDQIPVNNGVMPIDYGFLKDTHNEVDKDEVDVLILTDKKLETGQEIEVEPLALLNREDGDHKVLVKQKGHKGDESWQSLPEDMKKLILEYFSFHYQITVEDNKTAAEDYINQNKISTNKK